MLQVLKKFEDEVSGLRLKLEQKTSEKISVHAIAIVLEGLETYYPNRVADLAKSIKAIRKKLVEEADNI